MCPRHVSISLPLCQTTVRRRVGADLDPKDAVAGAHSERSQVCRATAMRVYHTGTLRDLTDLSSGHS